MRVAVTDDALRFVTKLALAVAAGAEPLDRELWFRPDGAARHLEWARWADALLVAPASADALASAASGRADDVVSALALAGVPRVLWAPAMNTAMWEHPATRANVERLRTFGHELLGPASGPLASRGEGAGAGRMLEPEELAALVTGPRDLAGRRVLVSAGPTREWLDPVRFLSNPSSGRMGYAVAEAALRRGAEVALVSGPVALEEPAGVELTRVESAEEMRSALLERFERSDLLVMTAAVADWRPARTADRKEPKEEARKELELVRTPDILAELGERRRPGQVLVGFAMETHEGVERAAAKAQRKRLDFICLNYPTRGGSAFGGPDNEVTVVRPDGSHDPLPRMSKRAVAAAVLDRAVALLDSPQGG